MCQKYLGGPNCLGQLDLQLLLFEIRHMFAGHRDGVHRPGRTDGAVLDSIAVRFVELVLCFQLACTSFLVCYVAL